jgi:hypothetical protein
VIRFVVCVLYFEFSNCSSTVMYGVGIEVGFRTIYIHGVRCIYGNSGWQITKYAIMYGVPYEKYITAPNYCFLVRAVTARSLNIYLFPKGAVAGR